MKEQFERDNLAKKSVVDFNDEVLFSKVGDKFTPLFNRLREMLGRGDMHNTVDTNMASDFDSRETFEQTKELARLTHMRVKNHQKEIE